MKTVIPWFTLLFALAPLRHALAADLCPPGTAARNTAKAKADASGDEWSAIGKLYEACATDLSGEDWRSKALTLYGEVINSYNTAIAAYQAEEKRSQGVELQLRSDLERKQKESAASLAEAERKLVAANARAAADPQPKPLAGAAKLGVDGVERLAVRFEGGFGAGRLSRSVTQKEASHNGGLGQVSVMARFPFPRLAVLFGPYYSLWRAINRTDDVRLADATVHSFGGKFELAWGLGKKVKHWLSIHPSLEGGLDFVKFDFNLQHPTDNGYQDSRYINMVGFAVAGNLNVCVWHASVCLGGRLRSVPGQLSVPTTQITLGIDPVRLVAGVRARRR